METKGFNKTGRKMKDWDIIWKQRLGKKECPYMIRYALLTPFFSIRFHDFKRSDDARYLHDHPWDFWTFILKGHYYDVSDSITGAKRHRIVKLREKFKLYYVKAEHKHYVSIPKSGCWTLVLTKSKKRKWGFWVKNTFLRPLRFFHRYGHPPCSEQ